jgi:hypothetical protein
MDLEWEYSTGLDWTGLDWTGVDERLAAPFAVEEFLKSST